MSPAVESVVSIATAITGVAIIALLVSKKSNTAQVIQAGASGFSNALGEAISPVTGTMAQPNLSYPGGGAFNGSLSFSPSSINMGN